MVARVGVVVVRLVAPAGFVTRTGGTASPGGRLSEREDVGAKEAGSGPVVRGPSERGAAAVARIAETLCVGGRPSGCGVTAVGAAAREADPLGWELRVPAEVGPAAADECLEEPRGAVAMVPGVVPEGRT